MRDDDEAFDLPRFRERLAQISAREADLKTDTHQRYKKGKVPGTFIRLLKRRPDLAQALCQDLAAERGAA